MLISFKNISSAIVCGLILTSAAAEAADVTLLSGFYRRSSPKIDGKSTGSTSEISVGGRYTDELTTETAWLGGAEIAIRNYSASRDLPSPDNSVGMVIRGGARYYFKPFAEAIVPYLSGIASIVNTKSATWVTDGYNQTTISGLYYGGNAGIRSGLGGNFFVELEIPLFESPLFSATEVERVRKVGTETVTSKEESTDTALYATTVAPITEIRLGLGMKL
jgi:hypothetical protein